MTKRTKSELPHSERIRPIAPMLKMSQFSFVGLVPLFTIVAALVPHPYTVGALAGVVAVVLVHFSWDRKVGPADHAAQQIITADVFETEA